jgi:hypothetical protein
VSNWRRRAIEAFPSLARDLRASRISNPYDLFTNLRVMAEQAHRQGDEALLQRIYGYAEWGSRQQAPALWNPVGVAFYEHIVENPATVDRVLPWLSAYVIRKHWDLWQVSLGERWTDLRPKLEARLETEDDPGSGVSWSW